MPRFGSLAQLHRAAGKSVNEASSLMRRLVETYGPSAKKAVQAVMEAGGSASEREGIGAQLRRATTLKNTPLNEQHLMARIAMAFGTPENASERALLSELVPLHREVRRATGPQSGKVVPTKNILSEYFGVPYGLSQWVTGDMANYKKFLDSAVAASPKFLSQLQGEDLRLALAANKTPWPSLGKLHAAITHQRKLRGGAPLTVVGQSHLWPATFQDMPADIHAKLRRLNNFALVAEDAPPKRALEALLRSAGVARGDEARLASAWWGDANAVFVESVASRPFPPHPNTQQFRGYGGPLYTFELGSTNRDPKDWVLRELPAAMRDAVARGELPAFGKTIAKAGIQPAEYVGSWLANNKRPYDVQVWKKFVTGKSPASDYNTAARELDALLEMLPSDAFERFSLVKADNRANPRAGAAYMWRMLEHLKTNADLSGKAVKGADAQTAVLSAKGLAFARTLLLADKRLGLALNERVLPHLPPDVQLRAMEAPRALMQEIEPFFSRSALAGNLVSRQWTLQQVSATRATGGVLSPHNRLGKLVLSGMEQYYGGLKPGETPSFNRMVETIRERVRSETVVDPALKRDVALSGLLASKGTQYHKAQAVLRSWLAVPKTNNPTMPSSAQFELYKKVVLGAAPMSLLVSLTDDARADETNDADRVYHLQREEEGDRDGGLLGALALGTAIPYRAGKKTPKWSIVPGAVPESLESYTEVEPYKYQFKDEQIDQIRRLRKGAGPWFHSTDREQLPSVRTPDEFSSGAFHFGTKEAAISGMAGYTAIKKWLSKKDEQAEAA